MNERSPKRLSLICVLSLVTLFQGITLLWMQCCCGDSGLKPCACQERVDGLQITSADQCTCAACLISTPHKPVPVPQPFTFVDYDQNQTQLSPAEHTPPIAPGTAVLHRGLKAPPPETLDTLLSSPFLCVFRC